MNHGIRQRSSFTEEQRRERHRRLCEASRTVLTGPEYKRVLVELKMRCAAARRQPVLARRKTDIEFDRERECQDGWALEPIGNIFA